MVSGGVQISTAKTGRIIDALMTGQLTAEEAKAKLGVPPPKKEELLGPTLKQQQIRKAASLFKGVEGLLRAAETEDPAQPRPRRGSKDSFDTSSDEEEHARIEQEVARFEMAVGKSVDVCRRRIRFLPFANGLRSGSSMRTLCCACCIADAWIRPTL